MTNDPLARCPFCGSTNVDRHYARHADGYDPGCLDCENTRPMEQWAAKVLTIGLASQKSRGA